MSQEQFFKKRSKRLGYLLGVSCFLNISLLSFGMYEWKEGGFSFLAVSSFRPQKSKLYRQNGTDLPTLTKSLQELDELDFQTLTSVLKDNALVAEGYSKQALALSLLAHRHYFDVQRALGHPIPVRRLFTYISEEIVLYPDLDDKDFQKAHEFATSERFPKTCQGLLLQHKEMPDPLLKETILQTSEYRTVEILLTRGTDISRDAIFDLLQKIDYKEIQKLHQEMLKAQDFSPEVRRGFLIANLPHSAEILYKTDPRFAAHTLSDKQVLSLLSTLESNPQYAKEYAVELLDSPRSKAIWNRAYLFLCDQLQLDPKQETRDSMLKRFGRVQPKKEAPPAPPKKKEEAPAPKTPAKPSAKPSPKPAPIQPPKEKLHVVQQGDTLWHLSKRYGIDIQTLKKYNKLSSDALKPGSTLKIPPKAKDKS